MGFREKPVCLKVFIDKAKKKVMFAEANEDFVEILFSFLTLPLGTITRLSSKYTKSNDIKVGSLSSLYESVENLDVVHFIKEAYKDFLVNPRNSSHGLCRKLKVDLNTCVTGYDDHEVFLKKKGLFIITDDLYVRPFILDNSIELLKTLGVEYINLLDERHIYFGVEEFLNLLKWSLWTNNPLTNFVFGGGKACLRSSCVANSILGISARDYTVKLMVQKSKKKVLCALVDNFFVDILFRFLTCPLGAVKQFTMDNSYPVGINKVYYSIFYLEDGKYLKSEAIKTKLLYPKVAVNYYHVTDIVKEQDTFVVSDDLNISLSPSISIISKLTVGVSLRDIEVLEVCIGELEMVLILRASLTSTSVFTDCLDAFRKKPKAKSST